MFERLPGSGLPSQERGVFVLFLQFLTLLSAWAPARAPLSRQAGFLRVLDGDEPLDVTAVRARERMLILASSPLTFSPPRATSTALVFHARHLPD